MKNPKKILEYTKELNLLYVEDDKSMQKRSVEMFSNFFDNITTADNCQEGLDLYNKSSFDIVITDISMPKMDGIELNQNIRQYNPSIPIIVFSAWNDSTNMSACISLDIDAYMLKPLDSSNLIDALYKVYLKVKNNREIFKKVWYWQTDKFIINYMKIFQN